MFCVAKQSSDHKTLVAAFAAVGLTALVIAVCRECSRKLGTACRTASPSSPPVELAMHQRNSAENEASGQSVHYYMEVPDSPPPSDESVSDEDPSPPPVCHGPGNPPDDYLVPQPSRDETEEEGAEWKTVPFYENTQLRNTDLETSAEPPRDQ
ncbi:hypothetical protein BaRGS_00039783, partial [Batillaria attramentaria]